MNEIDNPLERIEELTAERDRFGDRIDDLAAEVIRLRTAMQQIADGNVPMDRPAFVWHDKYQSLRDFARKRLEDTK